MAKQLKLKVVTPERLILEEMVDAVTLPTTGGELTILPNHIPIIIGLASGDIVAKTNGEDVPMAVVGGFVEVKKDSDGNTLVAVLADFAEHVGGLTDEVIAQAQARAEELKQQMANAETVNFEHFESELARSIVRARIGDKWRTRKYRKVV